MIVYCIENKVNGKKYVGITKQGLKNRFRQHVIRSSKETKEAVHHAIAKYGVDSFLVYEIDRAETKEDLYKKEIHWIKELDTKKNGYNSTDGGEGSLGRKLSPSTILKLKEAAQKRWTDPNQREIQRINQSGKKHSIETRKKLSMSKIGNTNKLGKQESEITRKRKSVSLMGNKNATKS